MKTNRALGILLFNELLVQVFVTIKELLEQEVANVW